METSLPSGGGLTFRGAALVGTIAMTILLVSNFVSNVLNVLRGVDAPVVLFSSFIGSGLFWRGSGGLVRGVQYLGIAGAG
jgi:hypothetical protein